MAQGTSSLLRPPGLSGRGPNHLVPLSAIRQVARQIAARFRPDAVVLFGSYAYGQPREQSDVDLLVVMPASDEAGRARHIEASVDPCFKLDVHVRTPERLRDRLREGDWFLCEVIARGKVLFGKLPPEAAWANVWFYRGHALVTGLEEVESSYPPMKKTTAEWVRKAEEDWIAANRLSTGKRPVHQVTCFCCQQAAEKYFKALLQEKGLPVPRTHELDDLLELLVAHDAGLKRVRRGLRGLTKFAVDIRYPGLGATARKTQTALRVAGRVRQEIRTRLGIRARSERRRKRP